MSAPKIAVSSMTTADAFTSEGVGFVIAQLGAMGLRHLEISQHIRFDAETIPEFLAASEAGTMAVCAISCRFDGGVPSPVPEFICGGVAAKVWQLETDFDELVTLCRQFRCQYLRFAGFPGMALTTEKTLRTYLAQLEEVAAQLHENGIVLCVHNHADEFMQVDGKWLLRWAMELCPHLQMELDVRNAFLCGVNPCDLLREFSGRVPLLHIQDIQVCPSGSGADAWLHPEYRGVAAGQGNIHWQTVCDAACAAGSEYLIIEQGRFYGEDPIRCVEIAAKTLRQCLAAHI